MDDIATLLRQWSHHGQAYFMSDDLKRGAIEIQRLRKLSDELLLALEGTLLGCEAHGLGSHPIAEQARAAIAHASTSIHPDKID